jgi:hypothetical protein
MFAIEDEVGSEDESDDDGKGEGKRLTGGR